MGIIASLALISQAEFGYVAQGFLNVATRNHVMTRIPLPPNHLVIKITAVLGLLLALVSAAHADIEIAPYNQLVWPSDGSSVTLIFNIHEQRAAFDALSQEDRSSQIATWVADFYSRQFETEERAGINALTAYIISVADMDEYGSSGETVDTVAKLDYEGTYGELTLTLVESALNFAEFQGQPLLVAAAASADDEPKTITATINKPTTFFLAEGIKQSLFFESLVLVDDPFEFIYASWGAEAIVSSRKPRYVTFAPEIGQAGTFELMADIRNYQYEPVKQQPIQVVVAPAASAPENGKLNILVVGHSLATIWPAYLHKKFVDRDDFEVMFVGSLPFFHTLHDVDEAIYSKTNRDASSAFSVANLLTSHELADIPDPNQPAKSPYVFDDGTGTFGIDMARYRDETLAGTMPDIILLNTGDGDIWAMPVDDEVQRNAMLEQLQTNVVTLLSHFKELNPAVKIGLVMPPNYNRSNFAWTLNYKDNYNRVTQLKRRYHFMKIMKGIAANDPQVTALATEFVNDADNDFPHNSGTHLSLDGLNIFSEQMYAWIKSTLPVIKHRTNVSRKPVSVESDSAAVSGSETEQPSQRKSFWDTINPFN